MTLNSAHLFWLFSAWNTVWISFYPTSCFNLEVLISNSTVRSFICEVHSCFYKKNKTKWRFLNSTSVVFLEVSPGILCAQPSISLRLLTGPRGRDLLRYNVVCISAPTIAGKFLTFFQLLSYQHFFQSILQKSYPMYLLKSKVCLEMERINNFPAIVGAEIHSLL